MSKARAQQALVVATSPPMRCGIGSYAAQQVLAMRRQGIVTHTAAINVQGMGTYSLLFASPRSMGRFALDTMWTRFDRIDFHYVDSFIPPNLNQAHNFLMSFIQMAMFAYLRLKARGAFTLVVHEFIAGDLRGRMFDVLRKSLFALSTRQEFHTAIERDKALSYLGLSSKRAALVPHDRYFEPRFLGTKAQAREQLGLPEDRVVFLCIGFLQAHKAFERAIAAFVEAGREDAYLYIVGSARVQEPLIRLYRRQLKALARTVPRVHLIDRYVDDVEFDAWICAADMVVVPYREIWTSGVLARAGLYHRPVALQAHATLIEQARGRSILPFDDEAALADIMRAAHPSSDAVNAAGGGPSRRAKLLLVAPLYGAAITGGAEGVIARFAGMLADRYDVEVWSTKSSRLEPRDNALNEGAPDARIALRRFETNVDSEPLFRFVHRRVSQGSRNLIWQHLWKNACLNGIGLAEALAAEQGRFDAIILPHYFYGSTHLCAPIAPQKTILHPFIHDEPALRTKVIGRLFGAASVAILNSQAELAAVNRALTTPVFDARVVGNVVAPPTPRARQDSPDLPALRAAIGDAPYLLYIGRITADKNVDDLVRWFQHTRTSTTPELKLVLVGEGPLTLTGEESEGVLRFPRVSEGAKWALLEECLALTQLSVLESFSIVLMEAWLSGRPVIVNSAGDATTLHVAACKGGFAVASPAEFVQTVAALRSDPASAAAMAARGAAYVKANYSRERVQELLFSAVDGIVARQAGAPQPQAAERLAHVSA